MHHRGPDHAGLAWLEQHRVGLAHCRLAVIDLSPAGHQPMFDDTGDLCIVFNGEIYNHAELRQELRAKGHRFRTSTDTEVILLSFREWGTECLQHFNGAFAFALHDVRKRRLFIARDRAGEKPLFYRTADHTLSFASELKALLADPACPRRLDTDSLECYLSFGYVPGHQCLLEGIRKLPPSHALMFSLETGDTQIWRYWDLPAPPDDCRPDGTLAQDAIIERFEQLLEAAVRRQLVADVPVGILLSGGVDSSLVTAMAVRARPGIRTFTITFPGDPNCDERSHARLIANHFRTDHLELPAESNSVDLLPALARQVDEPIMDSSLIPTYMVTKLAQQHCTVALGGDGADELFGGYLHYSRLLWLQRRSRHLPIALRRLVGRLGASLLPPGFRGRNWLHAFSSDLENDLPLLAAYFTVSDRRQLLARRFFRDDGTIGVAEATYAHRVPRVAGLVDRATRMDFQNYLPEDILVKVDRASMMNSLEMRAPWLDYRLIEFAFGQVPSYMKATATTRKHLPKALAQRLLPAEFNLRRKQGFSIPLHSWLQSREWRDYFREVLMGSQPPLFNHRFLDMLLRRAPRHRTTSELLFGLVLLELWRRSYDVRLPS